MRTIAAFAIGLLGLVDGPSQVTQSGHGAFEASLTPSGNGFAVAWYDTRDGHPEIYARLLDAKGRPSGPERRLTNGTDRAYEADIAAIGNEIAVAWYETGANRTSHAMLGMWTREGRRLWTRPLAASERISKNAVVRATGKEIFCAWIAENAARDFEVYAAWFDTKGNPITPAFRLGPAGQTTWNLNAAVDERGRGWVVYDARLDTRTNELFVARVDKTSSQITRVTIDDGQTSKYPDLAIGGDRAALTWYDERDGNKEVYLFVGRLDELEEGLEQRATRVTDTAGESIGAYVSWNAKRRRFGLAWSDNTEGQHEVYFEAFDQRGAPLAAAERLTRNPTDSLIPAIKPSGDGFALVWNEYVVTTREVHQAADARSEIAFATVK